MSDAIIQVENLSKRYRLGVFGYGSLQQDLASRWARFRGKPDPNAKIGEQKKTTKKEFWALKDVSFEVQQGEVLGVIGANGAGKSTLLKILSRITAPTSGRALLRGRVASMLEVGTGFHPELTGRENVFLNGAILGMTRREIESKFDEIVDFSGIEQFIDTPVKRYSSGMYVRLAFAVAAHLEPEILLVDEVLAVGDAEFQKKCLGKMGDVAKQGRTVLFVSHNMAVINKLCQRSVHLEKGVAIQIGPTSSVIENYFSENGGRCEVSYSKIESLGDVKARLRAARIVDCRGKSSSEINISDPFSVEFEYDILVRNVEVVPNLHFFNSEGICCFVTMSAGKNVPVRTDTPGRYKSTCKIPGNLFNDGMFSVGVALSSFLIRSEVHFYARDLLKFKVVDQFDETPTRAKFFGKLPGVVRPFLNWESQKLT